jgi:O-methyltransferase involved in polyketide biosynthesis
MKTKLNGLVGFGIFLRLLGSTGATAQSANAAHDLMKYNSISPSATALIRLKAFTDIPFARAASALVGEDTLGRDLHKGTPEFFRWLIHFENRYKSVDKMLEHVNPTNILEFSSGYSFRGLDLCLNKPVNFIDTDLPDVVKIKKNMVRQFLAEAGKKPKGNFDLLPLNVLDEKEFVNTVARFPAGPVTLINEGLLVYFDLTEKKTLCSIIHEILKERGGYWITADVYIKTNEPRSDTPSVDAFRKEHHLDENRFDDFKSAEEFFRSCGFEVVYREELAIDRLSCLQRLSPEKREAVIQKLKTAPSIRQTWCLKVIP